MSVESKKKTIILPEKEDKDPWKTVDRKLDEIIWMLSKLLPPPKGA